MTITLDTPITGADDLTAARAIAIVLEDAPDPVRITDIAPYLSELHVLCTAYRLVYRLLVAQAWHETGAFGRAGRWDELNAAGLGITTASDPTPYRIATGQEAARLHVWSMLVALRRWGDADGLSLPAGAEAWRDRWTAKYRDPACPVVRTLGDLNQRYDDGNRATWATDKNYGQKVADVANALFPGFPDQEEAPMRIPTTANVTRPPVFDLADDYARYGLAKGQADEIIGSRFEGRRGGQPRFIVYHIQDGITRGSLNYWASGAVDASSTVMVQKDGSVLRIVPEQHGPWTNGDVRQPTWQANGIIGLGGNPNNWSLSIEAEGRPWDAMPEEQRAAILWVSEDWLMRYPAILEREYCLLRHGWINSVSRQNCPGVYFDPIVAGINHWLNGADVMPEPAPLPEPEPPPSPYPPRMTPQMAQRLYGTLAVPWAKQPFGFDLKRSECRYWLAHHAATLPAGADYTAGMWPNLVDVVRRGDGKTRTFQWSSGLVYEQVVRGI